MSENPYAGAETLSDLYEQYSQDLDPVVDTPAIYLGCMDVTAYNYDPLATEDDGSCYGSVDEPDLIKKENIADKLSELFIKKFSDITNFTHESLEDIQRVVRGGKIQTGRGDADRIVLYQSDVESTGDDVDILEFIYSKIYPYGRLAGPSLSLDDITLSIETNTQPGYTTDGGGGGGGSHFRLMIGEHIIPVVDNLLNVQFEGILGQFVEFDKSRVIVDATKAREVLDTNIYELLGTSQTRQERINKLFTEYNALKPPSARTTSTLPTNEDVTPLRDYDQDGLTDTLDPLDSRKYSEAYNISEPGLTNQQKEMRYVTWLQQSENQPNANQSLEWLYDDLRNNYFIQEEAPSSVEDERPEYESKSNGYLKIRHMNQAILIRNEQNPDIGLIGSNPNRPLWLENGFTITMWVKFLDKTSGGTLFNYGNPIRDQSPFGFFLETYTIDKEAYTYGSSANYFGAQPYKHFLVDHGVDYMFGQERHARFVRLVVREPNIMYNENGEDYNNLKLNGNEQQGLPGRWRDSIVPRLDSTGGTAFHQNYWNPDCPECALNGFRNFQPDSYEGQILYSEDLPVYDYTVNNGPFELLGATQVPVKLDEWYFIVANYNPHQKEDEASGANTTYGGVGTEGPTGDALDRDPDYWKWNVDPETNEYVANSGYGKRCKVEIISKSDLLRARGFKVDVAEAQESVETYIPELPDLPDDVPEQLYTYGAAGGPPGG